MPYNKIKKVLERIIKLMHTGNDVEAARLISSIPNNIVFYISPEGLTLSQIAAKVGCHESLAVLVKLNSSFNASLFHLATENCHDKCVDFLVKHFFPDAVPHEFALLLAASKGNIDVVKASIGYCNLIDIAHSIRAAIANGHISIVKEIFQFLETSPKHTKNSINIKMSFCIYALEKNQWDYINWVREDTELKDLTLKKISLELVLARNLNLLGKFLQKYKTDAELKGFSNFLLTRVTKDNRHDLALIALQTQHNFSTDEIHLLTCKAAAYDPNNFALLKKQPLKTHTSNKINTSEASIFEHSPPLEELLSKNVQSAISMQTLGVEIKKFIDGIRPVKKSTATAQADTTILNIRITILEDIANILTTGNRKKSDLKKLLHNIDIEKIHNIFSMHNVYIEMINYLIRSQQFKFVAACLVALQCYIEHFSNKLEIHYLNEIYFYMVSIYYASNNFKSSIATLEHIKFSSDDFIPNLLHSCAIFSLKLTNEHSSLATIPATDFNIASTETCSIYYFFKLKDVAININKETFISSLEKLYTQSFSMIKIAESLKYFNDALTTISFDEKWNEHLITYHHGIVTQFNNLIFCSDFIQTFCDLNAGDLFTKSTHELQALKKALELQNKFLEILALFYPLLTSISPLRVDCEKIPSNIDFYKKRFQCNQQNYQAVLNEGEKRKLATQKKSNASASVSVSVSVSVLPATNPIYDSLINDGFMITPIAAKNSIQDDDIKNIVQRIKTQQELCFLVGSRAHKVALETFNIKAAENIILPNSDYDLATTLPLEKFKQSFPQLEIVGKDFKTGLLKVNGKKIDIISLSSTPDNTKSIGSLLKSDLARRIFNFNVHVDLSNDTQTLVFLPESKITIENKKITIFSHALTNNVFIDNPVAILRAIGCAARYRFSISSLVSKLIKTHKYELLKVNTDRLYQEIIKLFFHGCGYAAYKFLVAHEILLILFKVNSVIEKFLTALDKDKTKYLNPEALFFAILLLKECELIKNCILLPYNSYARQKLDEFSAPLKFPKHIKSIILDILSGYFMACNQKDEGWLAINLATHAATIKQFVELVDPELFATLNNVKTRQSLTFTLASAEVEPFEPQGSTELQDPTTPFWTAISSPITLTYSTQNNRHSDFSQIAIAAQTQYNNAIR